MLAVCVCVCEVVVVPLVFGFWFASFSIRIVLLEFSACAQISACS